MSESLEFSLIWLLRVSAILSFVVNVCFYCFLCCRWKLSKNIHWLLYNFAISELIWALAVVIDGILWEKSITMCPFSFGSSNNATAKLDNNVDACSAVSQARYILHIVVDVCMMTTFVFAMLSLIQFYFYLRSPWSSEKFNLSRIILVITVWLCCIMYAVIIIVFGENFDEDIFVYEFNGILATVYMSIHLLGVVTLWFLVYRLFYLNDVELLSNIYSANDTVLKTVYKSRRKGIRCLAVLIFFFFIPVLVTWFDALATLIPVIRWHFMAVIVLQKVNCAYMFLLGALWPFVWIRLDSGMGKELRTAAKYLKLSTKFDSSLIKSDTLTKTKTQPYNVPIFGQIQEAVI